jgi:aryl-alcohol dehydrogenase-like predicted oxidoreductase
MPDPPANVREWGTTGFRVPDICVGTGPLANVAPPYGYDVPRDRAVATVLRAIAGPTFSTPRTQTAAGTVSRQIGEAIARPDLLRRNLETEVFEVVLNHNRFTLIDRTADDLLDDWASRGDAFVNAAPHGGGRLVKSAAAQPKYAYRPAPAEMIARVTSITAVCDRHQCRSPPLRCRSRCAIPGSPRRSWARRRPGGSARPCGSPLGRSRNSYG